MTIGLCRRFALFSFFSCQILFLRCFRNCLVGKCYQIKICDFGSDSPVYRKDYVEMEDLLLVPLRWMAWESVIEVNMFNIWLVLINSFSDLRGSMFPTLITVYSLYLMFFSLTASLHNQVWCLVVRSLFVGDSQLRWSQTLSRDVGWWDAVSSSKQILSLSTNTEELPPWLVRTDAGVLEYQWEFKAKLQRNSPFLTTQESGIFSNIELLLLLYKHSAW